MVAHAGERVGRRPRRAGRAAENGDAGRHEPLAARLLAREAAGLEELDAQAGAPEQDGERRAGGPAARDQTYVYGPGIGTAEARFAGHGRAVALVGEQDRLLEGDAPAEDQHVQERADSAVSQAPCTSGSAKSSTKTAT